MKSYIRKRVALCDSHTQRNATRKERDDQKSDGPIENGNAYRFSGILVTNFSHQFDILGSMLATDVGDGCW